MRDLVIVGCGGFGREVPDIVDALNAERPQWNLLGFADDAPSEENVRRVGERGSRLLGTVEQIIAELPPAHVAVGIGNSRVRRSLDEAFRAAGWQAATLVHPTATFGSPVDVGAGSIICAGVRVTTNVRMGRCVHLNPNVTVGHDVTLQDYVSANPQAAISGSVVIEEGVLVGANSTVLQGLRVGAHATVGAAACVVRDVAAGAVVKGVPAR